LALAFALVAVIFALGNTEPVTVTFLTWQVTQSGAVILLGAVALGILIGILLMTPGAIKRNLALAGHKKKLKNIEKKLKESDAKLDEHKSKLSEFEEKVKEEERTKEEVIADVQKRLDETLK
jgi:uncharacterized integral membrane protein